MCRITTVWLPVRWLPAVPARMEVQGGRAGACAVRKRQACLPRQETARANTRCCVRCCCACGSAHGARQTLVGDLMANAPGRVQEARQLLEEVAWPVDRLHAEVAAMREEAQAAGEAATAAGGARTVSKVDAELDELEHARAGHERGRDDAARRCARLRCAPWNQFQAA